MRRAWRYRWCSRKSSGLTQSLRRPEHPSRLRVNRGHGDYAIDSNTCWIAGSVCLYGGCVCAFVSRGATDAGRLCATIRQARSDDPDARWREAAHGDLFAEGYAGAAAALDESNAVWHL